MAGVRRRDHYSRSRSQMGRIERLLGADAQAGQVFAATQIAAHREECARSYR